MLFFQRNINFLIQIDFQVTTSTMYSKNIDYPN